MDGWAAAAAADAIVVGVGLGDLSPGERDCVGGSSSTRGGRKAGWAVRETLPARTYFDESGAILLEGPFVRETYFSLFPFFP